MKHSLLSRLPYPLQSPRHICNPCQATEVNTALALQLHGKTKIELFEAANGAKVYEQVDENMVTNALQHLVNLPAELTAPFHSSAVTVPITEAVPARSAKIRSSLLIRSILSSSE